MVEGEGALYAVFGLVVIEKERPGVVHEDIQAVVMGGELLCEMPNLDLGREVGHSHSADPFPVSDLIPSAVASVLSGLRPTRTTVVPCPASSRAVTSPRPEVAPVTMQILPLISRRDSDMRQALFPGRTGVQASSV